MSGLDKQDFQLIDDFRLFQTGVAPEASDLYADSNFFQRLYMVFWKWRTRPGCRINELE